MSYAVLDRKAREIKRGYTREQAAEEVLSEHWTMHRYVSIGETEDGRYSVGGEQHFINADGDWDCEDFRWFEADTLDDVLDHVLAPEMGRTVFDEDDLTTELHLAALEQERLNKEALRQLEADMAASLRRLEAELNQTPIAASAELDKGTEAQRAAEQHSGASSQTALTDNIDENSFTIGAYVLVRFDTYVSHEPDYIYPYTYRSIAELLPDLNTAKAAAAALGPDNHDEAYKTQTPNVTHHPATEQHEATHTVGPYVAALIAPVTHDYASELQGQNLGEVDFDHDISMTSIVIDEQIVVCTRAEKDRQIQNMLSGDLSNTFTAPFKDPSEQFHAQIDAESAFQKYMCSDANLTESQFQVYESGAFFETDRAEFIEARFPGLTSPEGLVQDRLIDPGYHLATGDMVSEQQEANEDFEAHNRELAERQRDSERQEAFRETGHDAPAERNVEAALETSATAERDVRAEINALYREHFPDSGKDSGQSQERSGASMDFSR